MVRPNCGAVRLNSAVSTLKLDVMSPNLTRRSDTAISALRLALFILPIVDEIEAIFSSDKTLLSPSSVTESWSRAPVSLLFTSSIWSAILLSTAPLTVSPSFRGISESPICITMALPPNNDLLAITATELDGMTYLDRTFIVTVTGSCTEPTSTAVTVPTLIPRTSTGDDTSISLLCS